jgi:hypothetical protein
MRRLKEQVKKGERTAADALKELEHAAMQKGEGFYIKSTPTWRWLWNRARKENMNA